MRDCSPAEGRALIAQYHYAKGCSHSGVYYHGLYRRDTRALVGVAQWLPPTNKCARTVHPDWRRVLSLSRLVILPDEPQNAASLLIGASIRMIRKSGRWAALVTFADESQQHTGAIYKATNWTDCGRTKPAPRWVDANGKQVSVLSTKSRTKAQMLALGYRIEGRYSKRKFTMVLEEPVTARAA